MKGFSTTPVKVSEMREIIASGQFANWIKVIKLAHKQFLEILLSSRKTEEILKEICDLQGVDRNGKAKA